MNKVVFIGDYAAGKTSLIERIMHDRFFEKTAPTIGASFSTVRITTEKGVKKLNLWDTAGQERYNSFIPTFLRGANYILICTESNNIERLGEWYETALFHEPNAIIFVVITKIDQRSFTRSSFVRVETFCNIRECSLVYTSSLNGEGVKELFTNIALRDDIKIEKDLEPRTVEIETPLITRSCCGI